MSSPMMICNSTRQVCALNLRQRAGRRRRRPPFRLSRRAALSTKLTESSLSAAVDSPVEAGELAAVALHRASPRDVLFRRQVVDEDVQLAVQPLTLLSPHDSGSQDGVTGSDRTP